MERCVADENCQSIECGPDQPFMDGSIRAAHCSWWSKDACYKAEDFTLNPQNFILTCRQKGKIKISITEFSFKTKGHFLI